MFDIETFIDECVAAGSETEPRLAIKDVLDRAMRRPADVAAALPATKAEITPLYASRDLSVLKVVWAPGMSFGPHNHLMWAAISIYGGQEDNTFYRRHRGGIVPSGGKEIRLGETALLGDHTIHAVANPERTFTAAIHVYGGDITTRLGRSEWDAATSQEQAYDFARTKQYFQEHNVERAAPD